MKRKFIYPAFIIANTALLSSCALPIKALDKSSSFDTTVLEETSVAKSENTVYSESEQEILDLYALKAQNVLSKDQYVTLASLLVNEGYIKDARDIYEEAYRLYSDSSLLNAHDALTVNALEEDQDIIDLLSTLNTKDIAGALNHIESDTFKDSLMPVLCEGKRTYYLDNLIVEVGYTEGGIYYSNVYSDSYTVSMMGDITKIQYTDNSGFTLITIDFNLGNFRIDKGTFVNNVLSGDYSVSIGLFDDYNDIKPSDIYKNIDSYSLETYTGSFDESGKTTVESPNDATLKALSKNAGTDSVLVYAYNEDKTKCLYIGVSDDEISSCKFTENTLGYLTTPTITTYEIKDPLINSQSDEPVNTSDEESTLEVRVLDGHIQVFYGNEWIDMGEVSSYENNDPFKNYTEHKETVDNTYVPSKSESVLSLNSGEIVEEKKTVSSSTSSKTASSTTQTTAPAATTPAATAPVASTPAASTQEASVSTPSSGSPSSSESSAPAASTPSSSDTSDSSSSSDSSQQEQSSGSSGGSESSGSSDGSDMGWSPDFD